MIRLMKDGSLDDSFKVGAGANGSVYSMVIQSDGSILVGGSFNTFGNLSRNGIVRLNRNGSVDTTINFGTGANGSVLDIAILPDYKILVGGGFTLFDGLEREYFVQLHGGIIEGSGTLEFAATNSKAPSINAEPESIFAIKLSCPGLSTKLITLDNSLSFPQL